MRQTTTNKVQNTEQIKVRRGSKHRQTEISEADPKRQSQIRLQVMKMEKSNGGVGKQSPRGTETEQT